MTEFNWVNERHKCSTAAVFEKLKVELEGDVEARNALRGDNKYYAFSATVERKSILIIREGDTIQGSVKFSLEDEKIIVYDERRKPIMEATLTLNREGQCRLRVKGEECESWHFRKLALEDLFFGRF